MSDMLGSIADAIAKGYGKLVALSLNSNLDRSREACDHVLKTSKLTAANWDQYRGVTPSWESCIGRFGASDLKVCKPLKTTTDVCVYDVSRPKAERLMKGKNLLQKIQVIAKIAKANKCGNCGEFSALAFAYLYGIGVRPIDWMSLKGADHAFVVIGRIDGDPSTYASWGPVSAVCDPWGEGFRNGDKKTGTYPGTEFKKNMEGLVGKFTGVKSLHREE